MFERIVDLRDILGDVKRCGPCKDDRGVEVALEATTEYVPSQAVYCDVWACPECGHTVLRGEDVGMVTPEGERF